MYRFGIDKAVGRAIDEATEDLLGEESTIPDKEKKMMNQHTSRTKTAGRGRPKTVAQIVDPLLLKGGKTVDQMGSILKRKGLKLTNENINWYVHNRVYLLKEKGFKAKVSNCGTIKVYRA